MSFKYGPPRPYPAVDVDAIARRRSLFTQLRPWNDRENPPREADGDGHSLNLTPPEEDQCPGCGASNREPCRCEDAA